MLRKIVGEGDGLRFSMVKDVDDLVSLKDEGGRNIFDVWKESIAVSVSKNSESNEVVPTEASKDVTEERQENVQTSLEKGSNDEMRSDESTGNPFLDQINASSAASPALLVPAPPEGSVTGPGVRSVLARLSAGCKVEVLKTEYPWYKFRSICVEEKPENASVDWVLKDLQEEGSRAVVLEGEVGVGEMVVAWDKADCMFYRVVVLSKQYSRGRDIRYSTISIDFGRECVYSGPELRQCWEGARTHPALGIMVTSERRLTPSILTELDRMGGEGLTMQVLSVTNKEAILTKVIKGKVIRWRARSVLHEKKKCQANNFSVTPPPLLSLPPPPLPLSAAPLPLSPGIHTVNLLSAESPAMLYICTMSQSSTLTTTIMPAIQHKAELANPVCVPVQGSMVLAMCSDMWHRARLDVVTNNHILARLIDLGYTIPVTKEQLRLAEPSIRSWPAVGVPCVMVEWSGMTRDRVMLDTMRHTWSQTMRKLEGEFQQLEVRVLSVDEGGLHVLHIPAWEGLVRRGGGQQS